LSIETNMSENLAYAFSFCGLVLSRGVDYGSRIFFGIYISCFEFFSAYTSKNESSVVEFEDDKTDDNIDDRSDTDGDSESEIPDKSDYIGPKINDIIRFKFKTIKDEDEYLGQPIRSISTYGKVPIDAKENTMYYVTSVDSTIPNRKGSVGICYDNEISTGKTNKTHIHVYPVDEEDILRDIFWYINYEDMTICQYEDGGVIDIIESIDIVQSNEVFT